MPIYNVKAIVKMKGKKIGSEEVIKDKVKLRRDIEVSQDEIDKVGFIPALRTTINEEAKRIWKEAGYNTVSTSIEYNLWRAK